MTDLRIETLTLPGVDLGPENPLPALAAASDVHASVELAPDIPEEDQRYVGYGTVPSCLPYLLQDGYGRTLRPTAFRVAVLENDTLRATFLLELGGRLWSLLHKPTGRELLEMNPVFHPANLAIRNAWFSGGVEWNVGLVGHCPFTCSPLFAARVDGPGGMPILRLYEWERIRQVPFQIDAYLPDGSPVLFVRVRIANPNPREVPMYWWSNIAVPETPQTRVLVPADHAYRFGYKGGLRRASIPIYEGKDATYSTRQTSAMDFFFRIPDGHRPWIAALDEHGRGLVQASTSLLKGRKLFLWGTGPGGRRWQEFLSQPGHAYIEIQAGLARTQAEHLPMPAGATWSWLEAYGLMEADPEIVHGPHWDQAWCAVEAQLERLVPRAALDEELRRGAAFADRPPAEILQRGSGWGALERLRREAAGEPPLCTPALLFDDASLSDAQVPWLALLRTGSMPSRDGALPAGGCMVQPEWRQMLENSVAAGRSDHWLAWLHLGVMRFHAGERAAARDAWERSLALRRTPWAIRNLAVLARHEERAAEAADLLLEALQMRPDLLPLAVECGRALIDAGRSRQWLSTLAELPAEVRAAGRIRLLEGQAALTCNELATIERILNDAREIADLREGEVSLTDLWFGLHERRLAERDSVPVDDALKARVRREIPPPAALDFRMST